MKRIVLVFIALFLCTSCSQISEAPLETTAVKNRWWNTLNDPLMDHLADQLLKQNIDIQIAEARIREAQGIALSAQSAWFPNISASGNAFRGDSQFGQTQPVSIAQGGLNATWDIDLFGRTRAQVSAVDYRIDSRFASFDDIRNLALANLFQAIIDWRRAQQVIKETKDLIASQDEQVELLYSRVKGGLIDATFLERAKAQRAQTSTQLPIAEAASLTAQYKMERLLGKEAEALTEFLQMQKPRILSLPKIMYTLNIPIKLIRNRPDVRAARAEMLAAQFDLEKAEADLWPTITLGGFYGVIDASSIVPIPKNPIWSITASLTAPLLNFGKLQGAIDRANAVAQQACLTYKNTILIALQEARTALANYINGVNAVTLQKEALTHRQDTVKLARERFERGLTDMTDLTTAQTELDQATLAMIDSKATALSAYIALEKALGVTFF